MRSRLLVPVFALTLIGVVTSCEEDISGIDEGFDQTATWSANLNAANEVLTPPVNSPATGRAWFTDNGNTITFYVEYNGLVAPSTAAHIHRGAAGVNGAIMVDLLPSPTGQRSGIWAGTINMTLADISSETGTQPPSELRTLLDDGDAYVNIHSSGTATPPGYPGGEIRGQLIRR
jgi:hypothetical protein